MGSKNQKMVLIKHQMKIFNANLLLFLAFSAWPKPILILLFRIKQFQMQLLGKTLYQLLTVSTHIKVGK